MTRVLGSGSVPFVGDRSAFFCVSGTELVTVPGGSGLRLSDGDFGSGRRNHALTGGLGSHPVGVDGNRCPERGIRVSQHLDRIDRAESAALAFAAGGSPSLARQLAHEACELIRAEADSLIARGRELVRTVDEAIEARRLDDSLPQLENGGAK
jgi:hypothetical protein